MQSKRPVPGRWAVVYRFGKDYITGWPGWRSAMLGVIKVHTPPAEGTTLVKANYHGVLLRWRYWLPFERD